MIDAQTNEGSCDALHTFVGIRYHGLPWNQSSFDFRITLTETRVIHPRYLLHGIKAERLYTNFSQRRKYFSPVERCDIEIF